MTTERARLALIVIGPERREQLIVRYADRLILAHGMTTTAARRYAQELVDDASPGAILAIGQTWSLRDGQQIPGSELFASARRRSHTVVGFTNDGLVSVGDGKFHLNPRLLAGMWLTAWPDTYTLAAEPQPSQAPIFETSEQPSDNDQFDPRRLWITAHRTNGDGLPTGEGIPLLSTHYRAVNWRKPGYPPSYGNALNVPAYLDEHLADYRAGWSDFRDQFKPREWLDYFNGLGACQADIAVAAHLGRWLWERVRADVVIEYGGTVKDFDVMFPWAPYYADAALEAAPYAHPEWEIPADHRLVQCDGQGGLFDVGPSMPLRPLGGLADENL